MSKAPNLSVLRGARELLNRPDAPIVFFEQWDSAAKRCRCKHPATQPNFSARLAGRILSSSSFQRKGSSAPLGIFLKNAICWLFRVAGNPELRTCLWPVTRDVNALVLLVLLKQERSP